MDVSVNAFDQYEPLGDNQLEMVHDGSRYLPTIERKLSWLEREAPRFDICLYNAGMDPFGGCSIGGMQGITQKVLRDREIAVFSWCRMRGIPIAFVLAGGYIGPGLEREGLVALHRLTLEAACAYGGPRTGVQAGTQLEASQTSAPDAGKPADALTFRDLIEALGWHSHLAGVNNDLGDYWHLRFELLSRALGLPSEWSEDHTKTPRLLESLSREIIHGGFFDGFLEYTPLPGEMEIYRAHRTRIKTAEECVRERMLDYAAELLLTFWPQLRGKTVRLKELVSMGLPADQPDPIDFY